MVLLQASLGGADQVAHPLSGDAEVTADLGACRVGVALGQQDKQCPLV